MLKFVGDEILSFTTSRHFFRHFSTSVTKKNEKPTQKASKKQKKSISDRKLSPVATEMIQYLKDIGSESLIKPFFPKLLRTAGRPHSLYLMNEKVGMDFIEMIEKDLVGESSSFIAEVNPGLGVLTKSLLQTSIPKIHLYESSAHFNSSTSCLQLLVNQNPDRLEIRKKNLLKMWREAFLDFQLGGNRLYELMKGIKKRSWEEEPYMKVIGALPNINFITQMIMSVIFQNSFVKFGRIIGYFAVSPLSWEKLTAEADTSFYNGRVVFFRLLFDYKIIGVLPRNAFFPWINESKLKTKPRNIMRISGLKELEEESLYLVKIEPKADFFDKTMNREDLLKFFYFIKRYMKPIKSRVIPELEKCVNHCGPRLIAQNFDIYTEFHQLSPEELLKLYKDFSSWPEFETSYFLTSMSSYMSLLEERFSNAHGRFLN